MNIALDVMGGDQAPKAPVKGAIAALSRTQKDIKIILLGDKSIIHQELNGFTSDRLEIIHATEHVTMDDIASKVIKSKPDSSMVKAVDLVKTKKADAIISAGNTGALLTSSLFLTSEVKVFTVVKL